jgi:putative transposase
MHRWLTRYRRFGLAALARKARAKIAVSVASLSPRLLEVAEALALEVPPLPIAAIYRRICQIAKDTGNSAPSYDVIYEVVRQVPAGLLTLAHEGKKAYSAAFDLVHRREAERPNAIWQADHTLLDILVQRDGENPAQPWLTVILDDHSRAVAGYFLFFEAPSAAQTALALRQAIWRKDDPHWHVCGIPDVLYTDNGSDFTSQHLEQVAADLKMRLVFSTPGIPRGRGRIERFFSTISDMLLCELPGFKSRANKVGPTGVTHSPSVGQAGSRVLPRDLPSAHTRRNPNGTRGSLGKRRILPRMPESLEQLDLLLLTVAKARKVRNDGIHFLGLRYVGCDFGSVRGRECNASV